MNDDFHPDKIQKLKRVTGKHKPYEDIGEDTARKLKDASADPASVGVRLLGVLKAVLDTQERFQDELDIATEMRFTERGPDRERWCLGRQEGINLAVTMLEEWLPDEMDQARQLAARQRGK